MASAARREITVRHGKGGKDRRTMLSAVVTDVLPGRRQVFALPGRSIPASADTVIFKHEQAPELD
ncbi:MAG: hypothetical protein ACYCZI_09340 [Metallibacterium scheffleri]